MYKGNFCTLLLPIFNSVSLIMVTITRHVFFNISHMEHFSAEKVSMGFEKNMSFLWIPNSKLDWAPLILTHDGLNISCRLLVQFFSTICKWLYCPNLLFYFIMYNWKLGSSQGFLVSVADQMFNSSVKVINVKGVQFYWRFHKCLKTQWR